MPGRVRASWIASAVVCVLAGATFWSPCRADDLGRLVERAAERELQQVSTAQAATPPRPPLGELHTVKTADGWSLVAHRYKPTGAVRPGVLPVILCHGLTYNAQFWDLDPSFSFARYLADLGFDVWAVDLRGCGMSQKWVWSLDAASDALVGNALRRLSHGQPSASGFATLDPKFANWTMDHHIAYDVPAFVNLVRRQTGAGQVAWVGHSMGGIVALACLARYQNPGIGRLVTVGSQVTMPEGQVASQFVAEMLAKRQQQVAGKWSRQDMMTQGKTSVHDLFFNDQNVAPNIYQALSGPATDVPAIGLMEQYMVLSNKGELHDYSGKFSYAQGLKNITIPVFISCGAADSFAPPTVQKYLFNHVGSTDKTLYIFGKTRGLSVDAGHDDSLVGLKSKMETYPVIARWLAGMPQR